MSRIKVRFNDGLMESDTPVNTVSRAEAHGFDYSFATNIIAVGAGISWD